MSGNSLLRVKKAIEDFTNVLYNRSRYPVETVVKVKDSLKRLGVFLEALEAHIKTASNDGRKSGNVEVTFDPNSQISGNTVIDSAFSKMLAEVVPLLGEKQLQISVHSGNAKVKRPILDAAKNDLALLIARVEADLATVNLPAQRSISSSYELG